MQFGSGDKPAPARVFVERLSCSSACEAIDAHRYRAFLTSGEVVHIFKTLIYIPKVTEVCFKAGE